MTNNFVTEQETFWAGTFGDEYNQRNQNEQIVASNIRFFSSALKNTTKVDTVLELGSNIGLNLIALKALYPHAQMTAVEINEQACQQLKALKNIKVEHKSLLDYQTDDKKDLVLSKGVLIHINPSALSKAYEALYNSSQKYILIAEYYNPSPVSIPYRGHQDKLFKRDFAGEMLDQYDDLKLSDYGFVYHRDHFSQDDITWFLLEKTK